MALDHGLLIGIMSGTVNGTALGAQKSASFTVKPQYKEHKSGYPQITDIKVPEIISGSFKFDCEEVALVAGLANTACTNISQGVLTLIDVAAKASVAQGGSFDIAGSGFYKAINGTFNANDFGTLSLELECVPNETSGQLVTFAGGTGTGSNVNIDYSVQPITKNKNNLTFGTPKVEGSACKTVSLAVTSSVKYHTSGFPPVIDMAILESSDFSITAEFEDMGAQILTDALAALDGISQPVIKPVTVVVPTVGGGTITIYMANAIIEPDLSFSPGNDWNGISVKCTSMLPAGADPKSFVHMTITAA